MEDNQDFERERCVARVGKKEDDQEIPSEKLGNQRDDPPGVLKFSQTC
jgi:hypothetical protein